MAAYLPEFEKRWAKLLGFSCHDCRGLRTRCSRHPSKRLRCWRTGNKVIPVVILPNVSNEEAKQVFSQGFETRNLPSGKE
ncbi:hypothetical protein V6N13_116249 [Hibiscus sabdariffa]